MEMEQWDHMKKEIEGLLKYEMMTQKLTRIRKSSY